MAIKKFPLRKNTNNLESLLNTGTTQGILCLQTVNSICIKTDNAKNNSHSFLYVSVKSHTNNDKNKK